MFPIPSSGSNPMSGFMPSLGGDSAPAVAETGTVNITQGGLNVPLYPFSSGGGSVVPMDADINSVFGIDGLSGFVGDGGGLARNNNIYFYAAAGVVLLMALKKRWK